MDCQTKEDVIIYIMDERNPSVGLNSVEVLSPKFMRSEIDPYNQDDYAVQFTIGPDSYINKGFRSEAIVKDYFFGKFVFSYSFNLLVPIDFVDDAKWHILAQWHDQPDVKAGQTWEKFPSNPPPVALIYKNSKLYLIHRPNPTQKIRSIPLEFNLGVWNKLDFHIVWSADSNGIVKAYLNGRAFSNPQGGLFFSGPNIYNKAGNYFKYGIYRSADSRATNHVLFKDMLVKARCY